MPQDVELFGGSVADLLDRMLIGRIPDAAQRAIAVQDLISRRGLPTTLSRPTELFSSRAEVRTRANVSAFVDRSLHGSPSTRFENCPNIRR